MTIMKVNKSSNKVIKIQIREKKRNKEMDHNDSERVHIINIRIETKKD